MPKKKKEAAKLTRAEKLGIKFILIGIPALAVYGFVLGQQDAWKDVKKEKLKIEQEQQKEHLRMIKERDKALSELFDADVKPVNSWRTQSGLNNAGNIRGRNGEFLSFPTPKAGVDAMRSDIIAKISGNSRMMRAKLGEIINLV